MTLTPSQRIAAKDIDAAYDKLHDENETLKMERAALTQALEDLINLKKHKDEVGKTEFYLKEQPRAWEAARQVLSTLEA